MPACVPVIACFCRVRPHRPRSSSTTGACLVRACVRARLVRDGLIDALRQVHIHHPATHTTKIPHNPPILPLGAFPPTRTTSSPPPPTHTHTKPPIPPLPPIIPPPFPPGAPPPTRTTSFPLLPIIITPSPPPHPSYPLHHTPRCTSTYTHHIGTINFLADGSMVYGAGDGSHFQGIGAWTRLGPLLSLSSSCGGGGGGSVVVVLVHDVGQRATDRKVRPVRSAPSLSPCVCSRLPRPLRGVVSVCPYSRLCMTWAWHITHFTHSPHPSIHRPLLPPLTPTNQPPPTTPPDHGQPQDECTDPTGPKDQGVFTSQKDEYLRGKFIKISKQAVLKNDHLERGKCVRERGHGYQNPVTNNTTQKSRQCIHLTPNPTSSSSSSPSPQQLIHPSPPHQPSPIPSPRRGLRVPLQGRAQPLPLHGLAPQRRHLLRRRRFLRLGGAGGGVDGHMRGWMDG